MATSEQQAPSETPAANIVGNAFVDQYYHMLHESPELVHRFYQDVSKLGRPEQNGIMGITTTMFAINEKILSLGYGELSAEIISVDAQESYGGGVLVLVTGFMMGKDGIKKKFTQCFFLAPQEKGYFVLNDVFRYVDENGIQGSAHHDVGSPVSPDNVADPSLPERQVSEQISVTAEDGDAEEVYHPENGQASIEEEEAPVPEVLDEIPDDSQMVAGLASQIEEVPKKSYASIVKVMKEGSTLSSTATAVSVKSAIKTQEQQGNAAPPPSSILETNGSSINTNEIGNNQEAEAEGYSIYVKGLASNATPALLENEFKTFGPIKSGGIQVRTQKGFSFGFVEFEVASAVQSALQASPILINGRNVVVEEKRSTNRGNSRGRFSSGRAPGYRGEGARGRGNYGNGRSYGRGDFNGRGEYGYRNGNRGGFSSRGGDGYQRNDHTGTSGGCMNRAGGSAVNSAPKTTAVHVPASA
ncbi:putative G3BP-like protein [Abrus precatorius]|uniref:G3BP-like protein n=1 Tax=Abrus precatorius TaxID=3816 RepID=A0A8B8L7A6_ABRPR|nr:putative G3BP-like protein [Abrus precatorius]XP_027350600.1 putative G3BP-like protein [Abrus precatorius]